MKDNNKIMKNIERLGEKYCKKYLDRWDEEKLKNNWWYALKFFFSHSFMRGRRDELSTEYYYFTVRIFEDYFFINKGGLDISYERLKEKEEYFDKKGILKFKKDKKIGRGNSIKYKGFIKEVAERNPIIKLLITPKVVKIEWDGKTYNKGIFLGNDADVMMVLDVLNIVSLQKNIYNYIMHIIVNNGAIAAYKELIKIRAISDKIAGFIIRDIGLINLDIINKDYEYAFPVDTWVIKIAPMLGWKGKNNKEMKEFLIDKCMDYNLNPLKFAAGVWFLGFHSLNILIEKCLGSIKLKE